MTWLDNYERMLAELDYLQKDDVGAYLEALDFSDPSAIASKLIEVFEAYTQGYTELAAELAASFYEMIRSEQIGGTYTAMRNTGRNPAATEGAVRGIIFGSANPNAIPSLLLQHESYELRRAAGQNTIINTEHDPLKPRYARVPMPSTAYSNGCPFCRMLASRGFVYHTKESAGELDHYHADCHCKVVPSWDSSGVENYDPKKYFEEYEESKMADNGYIEEVMGQSGQKWKAAAQKAKDSHRDRTQDQARVRYHNNKNS